MNPKRLHSTPERPAPSRIRWWIAALLVAGLVLQLMVLVPGLWAGSGGDPAGAVIGPELTSLYAQIAALLCLMVANILALVQRRVLPAWAKLAPPLVLVLSVLAWYRVYAVPEKPAQRSVVNDGVEFVQGQLSSVNETDNKIISAYLMDYEHPMPSPNSLEMGRYGFEDGTPGGRGKTVNERAIALNRLTRIRWYIWQVGGRTSAGNTYPKDPNIPVIVCDVTVMPYVSPFVEKRIRDFYGLDADWRDTAVSLTASFYGDGKTMGLTIPWGVSNGHPDYNADVLKHTVQGDCR